MASSWIGNHVIDCTNITKSNLHAHNLNGIALCTLTLIHVWSILLPCATHKWKAQIVPGSFEYPLSERTPSGFKDANNMDKTMSLQVDDVFRMVEMTMLLAVLTPLSIYWMQKHRHIGIQIHRFIAVMYFVDIVRRHSHPHSWVLNTPIFIIWILDKIWSKVWRRIKVSDGCHEIISPDYMVLLWKASSSSMALNEQDSIGSNYFLKLFPSSCLESRHPFTAFKNRDGNCNFLMKSKNQCDTIYSNGTVVRIFRTARRFSIGSQSDHSRSHTERIEEACYKPSVWGPSIYIWGPFQGNISNIITKTLFQPEESNGLNRNIILIGSGSAINYLIDMLSQVSSNVDYYDYFDRTRTKCKKIIFLYSTRDYKLYLWAAKVMATLLTSLTKSLETSKQDRIQLKLTWTGNHKDHTMIDSTFSESNDESTPDAPNGDVEADLFNDESVELVHERLDYSAEIPAESHVFAKAPPSLRM